MYGNYWALSYWGNYWGSSSGTVVPPVIIATSAGRSGRTFPLPFSYRAYPLPFRSRTFPLDFLRTIPAFRRFVILLEIDFPSGTRGYSVNGARAVNRFYKDQILEFGTISRESSSFGEDYSISDLTVTLANRDQEFSKLAAEGPIYNAPVRALFGDPDRGYGRMTSIFAGSISGDWDISEGRFRFTAHDLAFDRYRLPITKTLKTLNSDVFPNLPTGQEARLVPLVYGDCDIDPLADLDAYDRGGPVPCYLIDPAIGQSKWRYVVTQCEADAVTRVFRYGLLITAGFTATTATYGGRLMTVLDFDASPVDVNRLSEMEITASVRGKVNAVGDMLANPLEQLADYLASYAETPSAQIHPIQYLQARDMAITLGYVGAWVVADNRLTHAEVLAKFSESFQCAVFATRRGVIGFYMKTADALPEPLFQFNEDELGQFRIRSNPSDQISTKLQYNYLYQWTRDFFERQPLYDLPGEEAALGQERRQNLNLWYVRDQATAEQVVLAAAATRKESVKYVEFELSPDFFRMIDLHSVSGVTHYEGIAASGGYINQPFRVVKIELNPDPSSMKIGVLAASA